MKLSTIPMICLLTLATLSGAALSHWWSLGEFAGVLANQARLTAPGMPTLSPPIALSPLAAVAQPTLVAQPTPVATPAPLPDSKALASQPTPAAAAMPSAAQKEFFESLLDEMKQLKNTNLALRDQMAETNRDLMQLEFRVDTQSASFRPLPVTENLSTLDTSSLDTSATDTGPDTGPGVLPPRAVMVGKPN